MRRTMSDHEERLRVIKQEMRRRLAGLQLYADIDRDFMNECIETATRAIFEGRSDAMEAALDRLVKEATRRAQEKLTQSK